MAEARSPTFRWLVLALGLLVVAFVGAGLGWALSDAAQRPTYQPAQHATQLGGSGRGTRQRGYDPHCVAPASNDDSDLCAQWSAIDVAEDSNALVRLNIWLSAVGIVVAAAGTLLLLRTLGQSDRALREAQHANRLAADATEANLRAWVKVELDPQGFTYVNGAPRFRATVKLTNVGTTPAKNVTYSLGMSFGISPERHIENDIVNFVSGDLDWADTLLFPGQSHVRPSSCEHIGGPAKDDQLHVFVVAAYETAFSSTKRITARSWQVRDRRRGDGTVSFEHLPHLDVMHLVHGKTYAGDAT